MSTANLRPDRNPYLAGEVAADVSLQNLAELLRSGGLWAQVRESSHYVGGRYLRVTEDGDFILEEVAAGNFLARAVADTDQQLLEVAARASATLAGNDIRHRFELYNVQSTLVHDLHHRWPQVQPPTKEIP